MDKVKFDPQNHKYTVNGEEYPSVTQIINYFCPFPVQNEAVERAAQFGTALHETLKLHDRGSLGTFDPVFEPYIFQWDWFKKDYIAKLKGTLVVDIKSGAKSATWPLQLGGYDELYARSGSTLKPGEMMNEQILAHPNMKYAGTVDRIFRGTNSHGIKHIVVRLTEKDYKIVPCKEITYHTNVFKSMVVTYHWLKSNKKLKEAK